MLLARKSFKKSLINFNMVNAKCSLWGGRALCNGIGWELNGCGLLYWEGPWCPGRHRLNASKRCALAAKVVKGMLGCIKRSTAGRWGK